LQVRYNNKQLEKVCTNTSIAQRKYGVRMTELILIRIFELQSANSVEEMIISRIGRCHKLHNNRKGQYAVDLLHPYRLIFEKINDDIQIVNVIEIVDYH